MTDQDKRGHLRRPEGVLEWAAIGAITIRVIATALFVLGPWTDEPAELDGWDTARFQEIAEADGRHWVDHEVEYPPGSVVLIEIVSGASVVETNRTLVIASLLVDLAVAGFLAVAVRPRGRTVAALYLLLGTPLVPAGLLRFDVWAAGLGAVATVALWRRRPALFAATTVAGALVKVFPVLLVPVALAAGRRRESMAALALGVGAGIAWLAYGGTEAVDQVLSLRGVTGWHLESIPGSLLALWTDETPRLEANAYRIGTSSDELVLIGRLLALVTVAGLGWALRRSATPTALDSMALMMTGSVAALLVTAPLLSPQFLLWLTPWAALLGVRLETHRPPVLLTAGAVALTAVVLGIAGPPDVGHPLAATGLLVRDGLLIALVGACARGLRSQPERKIR